MHNSTNRNQVISLSIYLPNRKGSLYGMISNEEIQNEETIDAGKYTSGILIYLFHLDKQNRIILNRVFQNRIEQNRIEQNRIEKNNIKQNILEQKPIEQNRIEKNNIKQNIPEQKPIEQNRIEKNNIKQNILEKNIYIIKKTFTYMFPLAGQTA